MSDHKERFDLPLTLGDKEDRPNRKKYHSLVSSSAERVLALHKIKAHYKAISPSEDPSLFAHKALRELQINYILHENDISSIPSKGPALVVANHPFGGIDGLILTSVIHSVRKDFKILANFFLGAIPDLRPLFFLVDPFDTKSSISKNISAINRSVRWVREGHMLIVFPAGEVSHFSIRSLRVEDPKWSDTISRLVHLTKSPVLPVYFHGRNSILFQLAGFVHPRVRTVLLPRELLKKRTSDIELKVGRLIPYKRLSSIKEPARLTEYLRFRTYLLGKAFKRRKSISKASEKARLRKAKYQPVAPPQDVAVLEKELAGLPRDQRLLDGGEFFVYCGRSRQIPNILGEIGRLREKTFRLVGEGTGRSMDLDHYDEFYVHLFVWNTEKKEVVGAYRLGATDEILPKYGKNGLYTQTLFKYRNKLLDQLDPALEMGRTFVRKEYQRSYSPLLLLWKGIGHYVALHPRYRILFGAVSITRDYLTYSRKLIAAFMNNKHSLPGLSKMVKPRNRLRHKLAMSLKRGLAERWWEDIEELSTWISGIEKDGKGVPILFKQYLKLGGKVICFNVDPQFGNTLDGLIIVDLTLTDHKIMRRYLGEEGFEGFKRYHEKIIGGVSRSNLPLDSCANDF